MIHNKSGHPVEVKKISIRLWSLRDEIEAAIARRMKECEAAGVPLYIEDIKAFYKLNKHESSPENVLELKKTSEESMASLMESIGEDNKETEAEALAEVPAPDAPAAEAAPGEETKIEAAESIIAEQKSQGLETTKPNPILDRPYTRQPPDLDKISYGFTLLSDINMDTLLTFTKDKFLQGQSVVVEFLIPQHFTMTGEIVYCNHYARTSRIISSSKPDFRVQCRFSYSSPGERDTLRNFLKSIEPTVHDKKKTAKKPTAVEDDLGL